MKGPLVNAVFHGLLAAVRTVAICSVAAGAGYTFTTLATFDGTIGAPTSISADASGNLYGITNNGPSLYGGVFELPVGYHTINTLRVFTKAEGNNNSRLLIDSSGNAYGTTFGGGHGWGTVYEVAAGSHTITHAAHF